MAYSTKLLNKRIANVGNVKITFSDDSEVTHSITSIDSGDASTSGTWYDQNSTRTPTTVEALGQSWKVDELPGEIDYGHGVIGQITNAPT